MTLLANASSNLPGTERPTPSLVEEEAPFENLSGLEMNESLVMGPYGTQNQE
jgi:hypothetical protein